MQVHSVLESLQQGILICDQHSRIVFFNQVYSDFIGVPLETAKGHKITDYRKSAIAPEVIWSGIPVEGMVRREGTQEYFASVYPIREEHHIRGSISIVTSLVQFEKRESGDPKYVVAVRTGYGREAKSGKGTRNFAGNVIQ